MNDKIKELLKDAHVINHTEGSIIVIKTQLSTPTHVRFTRLRDKLPPNFQLWFIHPDASIETISEKEMNRMGWYRKNATHFI